MKLKIKELVSDVEFDPDEFPKISHEMFEWASEIITYPRSLTGEGNRLTLKSIQKVNSKLKIHSVPSGTKVFDWVVPPEWKVESAYIIDPNGKRICDFDENPLHLLGYSDSFFGKLSLEDLQEHLFSLPEQPDAIPYVTSYYKNRWGFCISDDERLKLPKGDYEVCIETKKFSGELNYGEIVIPGKPGSREVLFSTYICHPNMANNEISGPTLLTFLAKQLSKKNDLHFTYRFIFIPETIGSLVYIKSRLKSLRKKTIAAFNVTCVGDERAYSLLPSRSGNAFSDKAARHALRSLVGRFTTYSWQDRGSDERQFDSPRVGVAMTSVMRSKYGKYPEYHTSLDRLGQVVTAKGLGQSLTLYLRLVNVLELSQIFPKVKTFGEPQLSKRGLYPDISIKGTYNSVKTMMDFISHADGETNLLEIADTVNVPIWELSRIVKLLFENDLIGLKIGR